MMDIKILPVLGLLLWWAVMPRAASAELSVTNTWRIEQAQNWCDNEQNRLTYGEYWQETVTEENRQTVCVAEQFAKQIADDQGDKWLDTKAVGYIKKCKERTGKDAALYYKCLGQVIDQVTKELTVPCQELGDEGLWETARCGRLISYIFIQRFEDIVQDLRPAHIKMMDVKLLRLLFTPVVAIVLLFMFVLDVVLLIDPGNWMRVPRISFFVGVVVLVSFFVPKEYNFVGLGVVVAWLLLSIIWNHVDLMLHPEKRPKRYQKTIDFSLK
jgi:hypothetical protein